MSAVPGVPAGPVACWSCSYMIDASDQYCRACGNGQGSRIPWYYKHSGIILSTLFGLGPFSLFLVWRSPVLSRRAKWIYTWLISGVSAYLGWRTYQTYLMVHAMMAPYMNGLKALGM